MEKNRWTTCLRQEVTGFGKDCGGKFFRRVSELRIAPDLSESVNTLVGHSLANHLSCSYD